MHNHINLLRLLDRERLRIPEAKDFRGGRVVITGAGGSIGSAIAHRLAGNVEFLGLIGHSEAPIFKLSMDLSGTPNLDFEVCDAGREPERWLEKWQPDLVIHTAAHKHVGLMEASPRAAFLNNTENTIRLASAAYAAGVKRFVFVSTDKAARPTSVMGASKRLAEAWLLSRAPFASICRFGNVAGSSGSLIEIVYNRLNAGQEITLTHREMKRFFITPDEAVDLVLASTESPGLYTLNMGKPVLVHDIMTRMMQQMGRGSGITISQAGGGEKLDEDLFNPGESSHPLTPDTDVLKVYWDNINAWKVEAALSDVRTGKKGLVEAANSL